MTLSAGNYLAKVNVKEDGTIELVPDEMQHLFGVEAMSWSDTIYDFDKKEYVKPVIQAFLTVIK